MPGGVPGLAFVVIFVSPFSRALIIGIQMGM